MLRQALNRHILRSTSIARGTPVDERSVPWTLIGQSYVRQLNAKAPAEKWDLISAICIERHPVITKPMNDFEKQFHAMLQQVEYENSMKSDHEVKAERENKGAQKSSLEKIGTEKIAPRTVHDFEDASAQELARFKFAPRHSATKSEEAVTCLRRKLDKHLLLLVEEQIGDKIFWIPPQGARESGETMIQAAERVLRKTCGPDLTASFYGNAPIGFYKYKYPKAIQDRGRYGAKVFYFLAKYVDGHVSAKAKHQWLDREELKAALPVDTHRSIFSFLIPDR